MFNSTNYPAAGQPASPIQTEDRLLAWYVNEYRAAQTADARERICKAAKADGYTGAQFSAVATRTITATENVVMLSGAAPRPGEVVTVTGQQRYGETYQRTTFTFNGNAGFVIAEVK